MSVDRKTRVALDKRGKRANFDEIEVGKDLGSLEWEVSEEMIDKQCIMDNDFHEWYSIDSPFGGRIAPPQIQYRPPRWLLSRNYNVRGVFYRWEFENISPIKHSRKMKISGKITDKWIKGDREFVEFEAVGEDQDGNILFRTKRVHALDVIKRTVPRKGAGVDSGIKEERI